jgi:hypothetical protein
MQENRPSLIDRLAENSIEATAFVALMSTILLGGIMLLPIVIGAGIVALFKSLMETIRG